VLLVASPFIPMTEYLGGMEPTFRSLTYLTILSFRHDPVRWAMLVWFIPAVIGVVRLANLAFKAHVILAGLSAAIALTMFWFATDNETMILRLAVYTGLEGVCPAAKYGLVACLIGAASAVWMFDELYARRELKSADGI
jgi:hypothetical protein